MESGKWRVNGLLLHSLLLIPFLARNYAIKGGNPRVSKGVRKCAIGALADAQASALVIDNFS